MGWGAILDPSEPGSIPFQAQVQVPSQIPLGIERNRPRARPVDGGSEEFVEFILSCAPSFRIADSRSPDTGFQLGHAPLQRLVFPAQFGVVCHAEGNVPPSKSLYKKNLTADWLIGYKKP